MQVLNQSDIDIRHVQVSEYHSSEKRNLKRKDDFKKKKKKTPQTPFHFLLIKLSACPEI